MEVTVDQIAQLVDGEVVGDGGFLVRGVAAFDEAGPHDLTFAVTGEFEKRIAETKAGVVLVSPDVTAGEKILVRVKNPYVALAKVSMTFHRPTLPPRGISCRAHVGKGFRCGDNISIGPGVVIGDGVALGCNVTLYPGVFVGDGVRIGDDVIVYPNVSILERCAIGNRVLIHAGTVIGSDGFGFANDGDRYHKIAQVGVVRIEDDVEIGASNTIDRATFGQTIIKRGVKTDNLVHIGHNVVVGEHTVLVAQVGISGSVKIGHHAILAGQAGVAQHLTIGDRAIVGPQAGLGKSVPDGEVVSGSPAIAHRQWLRMVSVMPKVADMQRQITTLERRLAALEKAGRTGPQQAPET